MPTEYDVVVIGGGPAGMMAAAVAGARGKRVLLLEKNPTLGVKLLMTGGGRCNVTNNKPDPRRLATQYGTAAKFLHSTFAQHAVTDTVAYFRNLGVNFIEENEGRMFPATERAQTIYDALVQDLSHQSVVVRCGTAVTQLTVPTSGEILIQTNPKQYFKTRACIIATGGTARPETGSTGDGFGWLRTLGHTVNEDTRGLVPLKSSDGWVQALGGVSLPDVGIVVCVDGVPAVKQRGKLLFTHTGVSGPGVLNVSRHVGELRATGVVTLALDLLPTLDYAALRITLQTHLVTASNKKLKNILPTLIPTALIAPLLIQCGIDGEVPAHSVLRADRDTLTRALKSLVISISGLHGTEKAVVAGGGVDLTEVDFKTMQSRIVPGLYLVGDMLNINRPSGGYSLQLCWSTGYVAGTAV